MIAVVGSACATAAGAYDDLQATAEFCRRQGCWFHVDAAHGGAAAFSKKYRHLLAGVEQADSLTLDFHKLLLTPALATAVVFRTGSDGYRTFQQDAAYLLSEGSDIPWYDLAHRTFECTKFMISVKVASVLCQCGMPGWDEHVTRQYDLARAFAERIEATPPLQLLTTPQSNIVCYRYATTDPQQSDEINRRIRQKLLHEGHFYVVQSCIAGRTWLRSTLSSSATTLSTLDRLLTRIRQLGDDYVGDSAEVH